MYLVIRKNISAFCINVYNLYVAFWATFARQYIYDCILLAHTRAVMADALLNWNPNCSLARQIGIALSWASQTALH